MAQKQKGSADGRCLEKIFLIFEILAIVGIYFNSRGPGTGIIAEKTANLREYPEL
jgi:hypothetical protein